MSGLSMPPASGLRVSFGSRQFRPTEKVVVCGSSRQLGEWDPHSAPAMRQSRVNCSEWVLQELPKDTRRGTPFKYVVVEGGLAQFEEDRPNRILDFPAPLHHFNALEGFETDLECRLSAQATLSEVIQDAELIVVWGGSDTWGANAVKCPGAIFHAFDWQFSEVARRAEEIACYGFDAVQLSPAQKSKEGPQWYHRYQPVQYDVIDGLGDEKALADACDACTKHGMRVFGDCVFNHMIVVAKCEEWRAAQDNPKLLEELQQRLDDAVGPTLDRSDFQWPWYALEGDGWDGPWRMEGWGCGEWSELRAGAPRVVAAHTKHLELLAQAGVTGIRLDAAKHMRPQHLAHYGTLSQELVEKHNKLGLKAEDCYIYGEVLSQEPNMHREYQDGASPWKSKEPLPTTDFRIMPWLRNLLKQGKEGGVQLDSVINGRGILHKGLFDMSWLSFLGFGKSERDGWTWADSVDGVRVKAPLIASNSVRFTRNHDTVHSDGLGFFDWHLESASVGTAWMLSVHDGSMLVLATDVESSELVREAVSYRAALRKRLSQLSAKARGSVWTDIRVRPGMGNGPPMLAVIAVREAPRAPWAYAVGSRGSNRHHQHNEEPRVGACLGFAVLNPNAHSGSGRMFYGSSALVSHKAFKCTRTPHSKYTPQTFSVSSSGVLDSPIEVPAGGGVFFVADEETAGHSRT